MAQLFKRHRDAVLLVGVTALVWLCYSQTLSHSFFWDTEHIFSQEAVRSISIDNLYWLLTHTVVSNWHPLTLAMHGIDFTLFGADPSGHHLVNVVVHCLVAIAVFYCVKQLARFQLDVDGAFFVAAVTTVLFALHPLRVESVAWVAARKDLLYSLFYLFAVLSYVQYVKAPADRKPRFYVLALVFFLASLLSKSMAVTLPALLILLDYFPLARLDLRRPLTYLKHDFLDKLPFVVLSAVIVVVTLMTQSDAMATQLDLLDQMRNAIHNVVFYLQRLFVPVGLVPFYSFPEPDVIARASYWLPQFLFIAVTTASSITLAWRGQPLLLTCWFGYLAMLAPASGVIHVGSAAAADRYTYLSQLPLLVLIAIISYWLWGRFTTLRRAFVVSAFLGCLTMIAVTYMQVGHWKNPITLWSQVLRVNPQASLAHRNLGTAYFVSGDYEKALFHIDSLAVQGWPVAPLLIESLNATGYQQQGLDRYRQLLEEPGLSARQRRTYAEIVQLLEAQRETP